METVDLLKYRLFSSERTHFDEILCELLGARVEILGARHSVLSGNVRER